MKIAVSDLRRWLVRCWMAAISMVVISSLSFNGLAEEDGAKLDRVGVSNDVFAPEE